MLISFARDNITLLLAYTYWACLPLAWKKKRSLGVRMNSLLLKSVTQAWLLSELIFQVGFWSCCFRTQLLFFFFHVRIVGVFVCYCCFHFISWILGADELAARPISSFLFYIEISFIDLFIYLNNMCSYLFISFSSHENEFIYLFIFYLCIFMMYIFIHLFLIYICVLIYLFFFVFNRSKTEKHFLRKRL